MNKVILSGRLTKDPDFRAGEKTCMARYTLAVDRKRKDEADFIPCMVFDKGAEFARDYLHKGSKIVVSGRMQTGSYEKNGTKIYTTDVIVEDQEFADSKPKTLQDMFSPADDYEPPFK